MLFLSGAEHTGAIFSKIQKFQKFDLSSPENLAPNLQKQERNFV